MDLTNILIVVAVLPVAVIVGAVLRSSRRDDVPLARAKVALGDRDLELAVRGLLRGPRPNKIMAIKVVRERTGMGLREAKAYVDALGAGAPRDDTYARPGASAAYDKAGGVIQDLRDAGSSKIEAIKRVRELTGLGLKEAKDFVEARWP